MFMFMFKLLLLVRFTIRGKQLQSLIRLLCISNDDFLFLFVCDINQPLK